MELRDTYKTIAQQATGLFKDKGSKFIAYAFPVQREEEIKEYIQTLKKEHFSARHHCYAWRLGSQGEQYRANDDGEPSGTAGRPILGQLQSHELTNMLVVVVRYFGGTLLGVSGLINAYKQATSDVIANAEVIEKIIEKSIQLTFEYPLQNQVMRVVKEEQIEIFSASYEMNCRITIHIRLNKLQQVMNKLDKIDGVTLREL